MQDPFSEESEVEAIVHIRELISLQKGAERDMEKSHGATRTVGKIHSRCSLPRVKSRIDFYQMALHDLLEG